MPKTVQTKEQKAWYNNAIDTISQTLKSLEESGVKREDIAMLLPLGMTTKIVDKRNVRNVISMAEQRMCSRAYWEYRELFNEYIKQLKLYSEEWATLIPMVMKPKCDVLGYCPEKYSCGRKPQKK